MKRFSILLSLMFLVLNMTKANVVIPEDMPSIIALIELHKKMAKAEDQSVKQVTESSVIQDQTTNHSSKFNEVRNTLNTKLNNVHQVVLLGSLQARVALNVKDVINSYYEFADLVRSNLGRKPQVAWYFAEANYQIYERIKLLKNTFPMLFVSNSPLLKASLSERIELFYTIQSQIDIINGIIRQAYLWCRCVTIGGFHYDYIWDILNSDVCSKIADNIINDWNQNLQAL